MANLYFPQLTSGALAQYPIQKTRTVRTIKNVLPSGSMILLADPGASMLAWQLSYVDLSATDMEALQAHFQACAGPFHAFTFIDPTDNMLVSSSDLTASVWQAQPIQVTPGATDPEGGTGAFTLTNNGQASGQIRQTLTVPANYQYCFSAYFFSLGPNTVTLTRSGASATTSEAFAIGSAWTRVASAGQLSDTGTTLSVGIQLAPGQQLEVYGVQLEAQLAPSRYRPTFQMGGVYSNAHFGTDQLTIAAEAPNLYSTSFTVETAL